MLITPELLVPNLTAGQNAVLEVYKKEGGEVTVLFRDAKFPNGYPVSVPPRIAVALGLAILEAAGVPIQRELGMRMLASKPGG